MCADDHHIEDLSRVRAADTIAQLIAAAQPIGSSSSSSSTAATEQLRSIIFERFDLRHRWAVERQKRAAADARLQQREEHVAMLEEELERVRGAVQSCEWSLRQHQETSAAAAAAASIATQQVFSFLLITRLLTPLVLSTATRLPPSFD